MRLFLAALLCTFSIPARATTRPVSDVLARMDEASPSFKGMTAKVKRLTHTAVLNDTSEETGTVSILKAGPKDMRMLIELTQPDPKSYSFQDRKAQIYYPKMQQVEIYDLGKHGKLVDQFLLLGFGTSGKELAKSYNVRVLGDENIDGKKAVKLELTPKSEEAREHIKKVEIWLAENGEYPLQQKIYQSSGDHYVFTYSDVKLNPGLTAESVALKLPKNVRKVTPQN